MLQNSFCVRNVVLLLLVLGPVAASWGQPPSFTVVDLGAQVESDDVWRSYAFDINELGEACGYALLNSGGDKAVIWSADGAPILNPEQYDDRVGVALNDDGVMVGTQPGVAVGWVYDGASFQCVPIDYIWSASAPRAINNAGVLAGGISQPDGSTPVELYTATLDETGEVVVDRLGTYEGFNTAAYDINDLGEIVAWAGPWYESYAVLYRAGEFIELPNLGGDYNKPEAINEQGFAVGYVSQPGQTQWPYAGEAVLWNTSDSESITFETLGALPDVDIMWAYDLNNDNTVVGTGTRYEPEFQERAFLWQDGELYDLNDLVTDGDNWELLVAHGINGAGQIVGIGYKDGFPAYRAFLLEPESPGDDAAMPGDVHCDGELNFVDIDAFVLALSDPAGYAEQFPDCPWQNADTNTDGTVDFRDINPFVQMLSAP
jgi:probable HAF family extracellular repeat protein